MDCSNRSKDYYQTIYGSILLFIDCGLEVHSEKKEEM
uniref:Uncharacterized protein n=1 Tax=Octopus bimaculoides TaxID=37653 RepID=A0A0L8HF54_OCTBM